MIAKMCSPAHTMNVGPSSAEIAPLCLNKHATCHLMMRYVCCHHFDWNGDSINF